MHEGRTLILSDLHLGRPHGSLGDVRTLRPLLEGIDVLVVNGDVAEVHHPRWWGRAAAAVLGLRELCDDAGIELVLLSGNHDPFLSPLRHLHLAGDRVFVTHGDVLHPAVAPWSPAAARMRSAHEAALADLPHEERHVLAARLRVSEHASFAEWADPARLEHEAGQSTIRGMLLRPWAIGRVLAYWRAFPRLAATFAAEHAPDCRFVLVGHTHRPGVHRVRVAGAERLVLNTGSFGFPGHPRGVVITPTTVTMHRLVAASDGWRPAARAVGAWPLPEPRRRDDTGGRPPTSQSTSPNAEVGRPSGSSGGDGFGGETSPDLRLRREDDARPADAADAAHRASA